MAGVTRITVSFGPSKTSALLSVSSDKFLDSIQQNWYRLAPILFETFGDKSLFPSFYPEITAITQYASVEKQWSRSSFNLSRQEKAMNHYVKWLYHYRWASGCYFCDASITSCTKEAFLNLISASLPTLSILIIHSSFTQLRKRECKHVFVFPQF